MLAAVLLMCCIGLIAGLALAVASRAFYVWEDPKELSIADTLPGANCGACGYPGCRASATAIAAKQAPVNVCMVGGGNSAIDAARTALRLSAENVHIIYRREREQMPAIGQEPDLAWLNGEPRLEISRRNRLVVDERITDFREVELCFDANTATCEAKRCFRLFAGLNYLFSSGGES